MHNHRYVFMLLIFALAGCEDNTETQANITHTLPEEKITGSPPVTITSAMPIIWFVHTKWIVADSGHRMKITLYGKNLESTATVSSSSSYITVEHVDVETSRIQVAVNVDPNTPVGEYQFHYDALGHLSIPFRIKYTGPHTEKK